MKVIKQPHFSQSDGLLDFEKTGQSKEMSKPRLTLKLVTQGSA
jgi:hypothetical protein